jgi:ATP phosphoribosyltransferase regulatory subunit
MRYYIGSEARLRRSVEDAAMFVFDGWCYEEVITPTVDYYSLFEHGMGQAEAQRGFRFSDGDGRLLTLRPDVTSSVARAAATLLAERLRPLRLCYAAPVFRQQQQSHAEWRRENTQLGCELIGAGDIAADLEILAIATEILSRLGLQENYCITINSVQIFNGIADHLDLDEPSREQMRQLIDTRESAELQRFLTAYETSPEERGLFARLTQLTGKREILNEARRVIQNPHSVAALDALAALWSVIESAGWQDRFEIDLGDVSSLDYYTGLSFKVFVRGAGSRVGRGGRYDRLTANFGRAEPAVGFVLDLDALTAVIGPGDLSLGGNNGREVSLISGHDINATFAAAQRKRANDERVRIEFA